MPFDVFTMAAIRDELDAVTVGARVDKVIQTSELAVALKLWRREWSGHLVVSAAASHARVYVTEGKLAKGFETPSSFLMLLRKYCTGGRIEAVRQAHLDRVLFIDLSTLEHGRVSLVAEVMGNRSNIILVGPDQMILGAIKLIGARQSRSRRILPHVEYQLPAAQNRSTIYGDGPKLDVIDEANRDVIASILEGVEESVSLRDALVGLLQGCSPATAADIAARAGASATDRLTPELVPRLLDAIEAHYSLLRTRRWSPVVITRDGIPIDFKAYAEPAPEGMQPAPSMSAAIEMASEGMESSDALRAGRARLHKDVAKRRSSVESRIASLNRALATAGNADELLEAGNLILGFQYQIESGDDRLDVPETGQSFELDPKQSVVENAERYFKRFRKAREAAKRVPVLLEAARRDQEFVDELDTYVDLAETPADLSRLQSELASRFGAKPEGKQKAPNVGKILTVDLGDGARALIGRSARQNEEVTFKQAGRGDIWLHARGVPGAHVVIRTQGADRPEDEVIQKAASLAAYYSKARNESAADVIVARVRDVHRLSGGAPGQVTVRNDSTVRVPPASQREVETSLES